MPRALRTRVSLAALAVLLLAPGAASAQISAGAQFSFNPGEVRRNNVAYDPVNQVYLAIVDRPPVRGRFLSKTGAQIGPDFQISFEGTYLGWVSISFGGPAHDPAFLVTYIIADDVNNPKIARFVRFNGGSPHVTGPIWIADTMAAWFGGEKAQAVWAGSYWVVASRVQPPGWSYSTPQVNLLDQATAWVSGPLLLGDNLDLYGAPALSCAADNICVILGFMAGIPTGYSGGTYAARFYWPTLTPLGGLFFLATGFQNEDQGVVYQAHTGRFLTQWLRNAGGGFIDTRLIGTDGWLSTLDLSRGIGTGAGCNAIAFNPVTRRSLLVTKRAPDTALVAMELGDNGYPVGNTVVVTPWDGSVPDYWPSIAVNAADATWLVSAQLSSGTRGRFIHAAGTWVTNGSFNSGMTGWSTFSLPTPGDFVTSVSNGVLSFYRQPLPAGTSGQGLVTQAFGVALALDAPVNAVFDLGNSSTVRKRITILLHDNNFSDLQMCTFWLAPGAPLRTYGISTHTSRAWSNATISFYAASTGSDGGAYLLDNVQVYSVPGQPVDRTLCVDPTTPGATQIPDSNTMLTNGNFQGGLSPWGTFGQLTYQITGGVFQFVRPAGTPSGVIAQATGTGLPVNTRLTATLSLGNSSNVRKRVTVIVHDNDFSDLSACTFWLEPGQSLGTHTVKLFTTKQWGNATLSVYPSAVDTNQWIRLDNASLRITLSTALTGTECIEPPGSEMPPGEGFMAAAETGSEPQAANGITAGGQPAWTADAIESGAHLFLMAAPIDLRQATSAHLRFESLLSDGASNAFVEVTRDGVTWTRVGAVPPSDDWTGVNVDLSEYSGDVIYVRFVFDGVATPGTPIDTWSIRAVSIDSGHWRYFTRPAR